MPATSSPSSPSFNETYHVLAEATWRLRLTVRNDLEPKPLTLTDLDKTSWDAREDRETCSAKERAGQAVIVS